LRDSAHLLVPNDIPGAGFGLGGTVWQSQAVPLPLSHGLPR